MKLSIITICLNNLDELRRTVLSVLEQTYTEYEYIVIDGGSNDGCKEYIEQTLRINKWVSEPDKGIYNAMNKGIGMAHGEYILFLNSGDTLYKKDVLENIIPYLNGKDFYVGHSILNNGNKKTLRKTPQTMSLKFLFEDSIMHQSTFILSSLLKNRPYNEKYKIVSDWEFFLYEWAFENKEYIPLDIIVSIFYLGGISNNVNSVELNNNERKDVIDTFFPLRVQEAILGKLPYLFDEKFERKIRKAMCMSPVQRDLKILRNSFKFLLADIFHIIIRYFKH